MHSLAIIGDLDALPSIRSYEDVYGSEGNLAKVSAARLVAEGNSSSLTNTNGLEAGKTHLFFNELGLSPEDINAGVIRYYGPYTRFSRIPNSTQQYPGPSPTMSVEVYAMRELADMVYHGSYAAFMAQPELKGINFSLDYPSALKIRLAAVPRAQRLATIIQELSEKNVVTSHEEYEIQLAINEGDAAASAAALKLQQMDVARDRYSSISFGTMFRIIGGTGDAKQKPMIERFTHDRDNLISYFASQVYEDVRDGNQSDRVIGY